MFELIKMTVTEYLKRMFIYPIKNSTSGRYKMSIIVRSDIVMGKGKTAAQCAHAAVQCYRQISDSTKCKSIYESWLMQGQPKVVLEVSNEQHLLDLAKKAFKAGLIVSIIKDAGKTQLKPGTVTTIGIGPGPSELIDTLTSKLKLL